MKIWKRAVAVLMLAVMTLIGVPLPAAAVSTSTEIHMGQDEVKHIDVENNIVTDPVLNNWVNSIADNLKRERARPDINYTFKIIDTDDINAFSLPGGFIYVNFGLLNFVNSDDELAGVMGHEMGHVERRHVVTLPAKAQIINLIVGIVSMFSVFAYRFGGLIGEAAIYKISRQDELQADQYGLMLMSRAGYDPNAMVSFMDRLSKQYGDHADVLAKYFEDHPGGAARVTHLEGYPQLSKTDYEQTLAQGLHDQDEGRYAYSLGKYNSVLAQQPANEIALLHKGEDELALGSYEQSQNALLQVANAKPQDAGSAAAQRELAMLPRQNESNLLIHPPNIEALRTGLAGTQTNVHNNAIRIDERIRLTRGDLNSFSNALDNLMYEVPNLGNVDIRPGSRLEGVVFDLERMGRDLNLIMNKGTYLAQSAPGLQKDIISSLNEMQAPLHEKNPTTDSLLLLPYYNDLMNQLNSASNDSLEAVTASRGAIALGWQAIPMLDAYFKALSRAQLDFGGDLSPNTAAAIKPLAVKVLTQLDIAADAQGKAHSLYFSSQARQIQAQITLLGVGVNPARYESLAKAIHARLGVDAPNYDEMIQLGMTPGDVAVASWLAAEERVPVTNVINEQRQAGKSFLDLALSKNFAPESLEVTLGLWYEGYAEKPTD